MNLSGDTGCGDGWGWDRTSARMGKNGYELCGDSWGWGQISPLVSSLFYAPSMKVGTQTMTTLCLPWYYHYGSNYVSFPHPAVLLSFITIPTEQKKTNLSNGP